MMLDRFEELAGGLDHPEGVAWGPDGAVYAGGEAGQIYRIAPDGSVDTIAGTGGFMYGVTLDGDGNVYGCDFGRAEVVRVSPAGDVETYSKGTNDAPLRVPNFSAFDDAAALYVTDSGTWGADDGLIYRVAPGGVTTVWSESVRAFPNGCCVSADGDALIVVESRARRLVRVAIAADGSAGAVDVVCDLGGSQPDGVAIAADGSMLVGCYRPDRIYVIDPVGGSRVLAEDPDGVVLNQPANVAFFGDDLDRIAVSSLGGWSIMVATAPSPGLRLRYPRL